MVDNLFLEVKSILGTNSFDLSSLSYLDDNDELIIS